MFFALLLCGVISFAEVEALSVLEQEDWFAKIAEVLVRVFEIVLEPFLALTIAAGVEMAVLELVAAAVVEGVVVVAPRVIAFV